MIDIASEVISDELIKILILGGLGLLLATFLTPIYTYFAYKYKFWKKQRQDDVSGAELKVFSKLHAEKHKRNIPTMAGLIFVLAISIVTLCLNLNQSQTWLPLAALVCGAAVGLIDDIINLVTDGTGRAGMRPWVKFSLITLAGVVFGWWFYTKLGVSSIEVPFVGEWHIGAFIIPLFAFIVVATGNAVNITDGLDGLAGGLLMASFGAFGVIALLQGSFGIAGFCFTVIGTLLSYLWFNIFPARFFMGDIGSFALGVSLGVVAMLTDSLFLLPIIGGLFVIEAGSSLLQIICKKFFGRRIFKSAPVHHHLEASGWPEVKITMRFWIIGGVLAVAGLVLALEGGII
ncbi:MAG: phospho-N-acetylmuramoyl-pentapeptide-transferase [Candidatus Nomurabacteria bacterium]|jgi:phospho-N-acetylmuramoyl-pentapeptide-transferase|nr:phospho-N-acetylmuramoyl-pentapeptide-transferase [Candidatus Nomurabacteria bacterium]